MLRDFRQVSVGCLDTARESGRALTLPSAKHAIHCEHIEKKSGFSKERRDQFHGHAAQLNSFSPILENSGHTSTVSVAGWPGSRTYRRAYSATQWFEPHLSGIIGIALWRYV